MKDTHHWCREYATQATNEILSEDGNYILGGSMFVMRNLLEMYMQKCYMHGIEDTMIMLFKNEVKK